MLWVRFTKLAQTFSYDAALAQYTPHQSVFRSQMETIWLTDKIESARVAAFTDAHLSLPVRFKCQFIIPISCSFPILNVMPLKLSLYLKKIIMVTSLPYYARIVYKCLDCYKFFSDHFLSRTKIRPQVTTKESTTRTARDESIHT